MKLQIIIDGSHCELDWNRDAGQVDYGLERDGTKIEGSASIAAVAQGIYSILLGTRSYTAQVTSRAESLEVHIEGRVFTIELSDLRDRTGKATRAAQSGPFAVLAQMPGKVVKLLVELGGEVAEGQGLIVVEAMKMQNEIKAPRRAHVLNINVEEGVSVTAGQQLVLLG